MAFVQCVHASNDAAGTTLALAITATTSNLLACAGAYQSSATGATAADGSGNTYTQVDRAIDAVDTFSLQSLFAKNITGGALTVTLTTPNVAFRRFQIAEESGLHLTSPLDDHAQAASNAFGAGVDAATTGNGGGTTSDGDKIVSFFTNINSATLPTAGTGFTSHDLYTNAVGDGSGYEERVQSVHSTADAATWTTGDASAHSMVVMMAFRVPNLVSRQAQYLLDLALDEDEGRWSDLKGKAWY